MLCSDGRFCPALFQFIDGAANDRIKFEVQVYALTTGSVKFAATQQSVCCKRIDWLGSLPTDLLRWHQAALPALREFMRCAANGTNSQTGHWCEMQRMAAKNSSKNSASPLPMAKLRCYHALDGLTLPTNPATWGMSVKISTVTGPKSGLDLSRS